MPGAWVTAAGTGGLLLHDRAAGAGAFYAVNSQGVMTLLEQYDDRVSGVSFTVTDAQGKITSQTEELISTAGPTPQEMAPVTAFELSIVGPASSESSVLSSGAGTITYAASTPLTVLSSEPACVESHAFTAETANTVYGLLAAGPANTITQTFKVTAAPVIHATGTMLPGLPVPEGTVFPRDAA